MTTAISPLTELQGTLTKMQPQFAAALPPQIPPAKFERVLLTAVQNNVLLVQANRQSLFNACMKAAQDGLLPDGREAALVTYKTRDGGLTAQYMPMVGGILKKVRNSGELSSLDAQVVYENDKYDSWIDEKGQHFKFKKARKDRGAVVLTFAYAITKDGALYFEEMTEDDVQAVRNVSRAKDSGPWSGPFADEMRRKTAIRRLSKRLPMSTDLEDFHRVIQSDDDMYDLKGEDAAKPEPSTKPTRLGKIIDATVSASEVVKAPVLEEPPADRPEPEPEAAPEPEPPAAVDITNGTVIDGVIEDVMTKSGTANGKPWTKYGCKIKGNWYSSFSSTHYAVMQEAHKERLVVRVAFIPETKDIKGKATVFRNIETIRPLTTNDVDVLNGEELPI